MRIQVQFGETQVLVPCGDGKITVSELVEKAILRYRKVTNRDPDDVIEVESVHLADENRTYVDQDDEVAESLEDKETIVVIFHDSSRDQYANDERPLSTNSISDPAIATGSSQTYSSGNLGDSDHTPFASDLAVPLADNVLASITEDEYDPDDENQLQGPSGTHHGSQDVHIASQDFDQVTTAWHGTSQHSSSHSQDPHSQDPNSHSDSGFAPDPTRSQESFPLKSQESFGHKSQDQVFPPDLGFGASNSGGTPPGGTGGSQGNLTVPPRSNLKKDDHKSGFGISPPTPQKTMNGGTPTRNPYSTIHHPTSRVKGMDIPRPGGYNNFPHGFHHPPPPGAYHDPKQRSPGVMDESSPYDNGPRLAHLEWKRAYPGPGGGGRGGEFPPYHHDVPPMYGSLPPGGMMPPHDPYLHGHRGSGRYSRPPEALMGHYPPKPKDARMARAMSHDRIDQSGPSSLMMGAPGGHPPFSHDDYTGPMEYHLSQPSPYYDRPGGMFPMPPPGAGPHPHMMGFDPRFAMGGPSGYSLSQPGVMMSHSGRGPYEYTRLFPGGRGRGKGEGPWGDRHLHGRRSIDEELDCFNEEDENHENGREKGHPHPSPFTRDFRKSVFRDGSVYSAWMDRVHGYGIQEPEETNEIPEFEGDMSQSQRSRTPSPVPTATGSRQRTGGEEGEGGDRSGEAGEGSEGSEDEGEDSEYGNIHIVELHKGEESLGIILTHYTSPDGVDLGVFIGEMDESGFAFKSGKLQYNDRVLACNGVDFTKEHTTQQVKDIFYQMAQEPLLRMAISRGMTLPEAGDNKTPADTQGEGCSTHSSEEREGREGGEGEGMTAAASSSASASVGGGGDGERGSMKRGGESAPDPPNSPRILPSGNQATPITLANTRQIGCRRTIELTKGAGGLGVGLTSRDVLTDNKSHPVYIKSIHPGGAAFQDGKLKLGDRLLSINGIDIQGMRRPEVVKLLRDAEGKVTLIVSRQEAVELEQEQDTAHFSPHHPHSSSHPETINKTVLTFDIQLYNSTAAGLGITVCGKTSTTKKAGDKGIYIKSVTPRGAAAMDGRLMKDDQILYVNRQNLTGKSNQEALDTLRKALSSANDDNDSKIRLVVARTISGSGSGLPGRPMMAVLGEKPEEEEREGEWYIEGTSEEVGIDVPTEKPPPQDDNDNATTATIPASMSSMSVGGASVLSSTSVGGASVSQNLMTQSSQPTKSTSLHSLNSQSSSPRGSTTRLSNQTSLEQEQPSRGSMRARAATVATNSLSRGNRGRSPGPSGYQRSASPLLSAIGLARADDHMGSGEFDRLEPKHQGSAHSPTHSSSRLPPPPTLRQNSFEALYDTAAASVGHYNTLPAPTNHYDNHHGYGYSPYDHMTEATGDRENKFTSLPANFNHVPPTSTTANAVMMRHHPPLMSRDYSASPGRHRSPISPVSIGYGAGGDYSLYPSNQNSRENSLKRNRELSPFSSSYDRHGNSMYSPYSSDTGSTASGPAYVVGVSSIAASDGSQLVPTRGSGRRTDRDRERDRNIPERGSGRLQHTRSSSAHLSSATSFLSDTIPDGVATLPRAMSRSSDRRGSTAGGRSTTPTNPESSSLCSLDELRLEDSESNSAFRRDDAGRISITKKTKKNPRQDLAHLQFGNTEPLVEGENSVLVRTGSDGCLNQHNTSNDDTLPNGIEVGPHLGLFKSSSLESLHNVMQHAIKRDIVDDGSDLRNRSTRNSFRRAVDRTIDGQRPDAQEGAGEQRGVDVNFDLEPSTASPAMISYTKKPKKKGGFSLKKVFKRKGSKKEKSPKSRKTQSMHVDLESIQDSLTPAERELLCRYQVNVRQHPELHSQESVPVSLGAIGLAGYGASSLDDDDIIDDDDQPILASDLEPQRHSMAVVEEYESPSSPDELLLSTMAKV